MILGAHPGYITWEGYEANLARLHENAQANGAERRQSPPREGPALLQGVVVCGRCGERMTVRYYMSHGQKLPEYICQRRGIENAERICQRLVGHGIDRAVGELLVQTVSPLALELALKVHDELRARPRAPTACATSRSNAPVTKPNWPSAATWPWTPTTAWWPSP